MRNFSGKRYWLIGASEGLGEVLARKMSDEGTIVLAGRGGDEMV